MDPYVHGLLYGPCGVVHLPTNHGEVVQTDVVTSDVGMVIHGERSPNVFLKPFLKGPYRFPYVLLTTIQSFTLIPVDYSTFLCGVVYIVGGLPGAS